MIFEVTFSFPVDTFDIVWYMVSVINSTTYGGLICNTLTACVSAEASLAGDWSKRLEVAI
jgi:hypothetical protein